MTKEMVPQAEKQVATQVVTPEQVSLVKSIIFPDATDDELKLFIYECGRRGVHPLDRKIFPIKRHSSETGEKRVTFQTSIDFMRSEGDDGTYAGMDAPEYGVESGGYPEWARVTVWRWMKAPDGSTHRVPFHGIARWKEYYPGEKLGFMWRKMPFHMLSKCAEAQARRMAWPQKLGKLYLPEEIEPAGGGEDAEGSISETVRALPQIEGNPVTGSAILKPTSTLKQTSIPTLGTGTSTPSTSPQKTHQDVPKKDFKEKTANDALKEELDALTPDMRERGRILKEVSVYTDANGVERFITYERIASTSVRWAGKTLGNLREWKKKNKPVTEVASETPLPPPDCTQSPRTCDWAAWEDRGDTLQAVCTDDKGEIRGDCQYA